jgi:hypothetical protein
VDKDRKKYLIFQMIVPYSKSLAEISLKGLADLIKSKSSGTSSNPNLNKPSTDEAQIVESVNTVRVNESIGETTA